MIYKITTVVNIVANQFSLLTIIVKIDQQVLTPNQTRKPENYGKVYLKTRIPKW